MFNKAIQDFKQEDHWLKVMLKISILEHNSHRDNQQDKILFKAEMKIKMGSSSTGMTNRIY